MAPHVQRIELEAATPIERYRVRCADRMAEFMAMRGIDEQALRHALRDEGITVTRQAVNLWLNAKRTPRPEAQAAIAKVLGVRPSSLFDLEQVA